jgi:hypothetical protein
MKIFSIFLTCMVFSFYFCSRKQDDDFVKTKIAAPELTIENNTVIFKDANQHKKTLEFISSSTTEELISWQTSLGFYSAGLYYELAKKEVCCPDETTDLTALAAKYEGKIKLSADKHDFSPLVKAPLSSWLTNDKGGFMVDHTLVVRKP